MSARRLIMVGAALAALISGSACGGSSQTSAQKAADCALKDGTLAMDVAAAISVDHNLMAGRMVGDNMKITTWLIPKIKRDVLAQQCDTREKAKAVHWANNLQQQVKVEGVS